MSHPWPYRIFSRRPGFHQTVLGHLRPLQELTIPGITNSYRTELTFDLEDPTTGKSAWISSHTGTICRRPNCLHCNDISQLSAHEKLSAHDPDLSNNLSKRFFPEGNAFGGFVALTSDFHFVSHPDGGALQSRHPMTFTHANTVICQIIEHNWLGRILPQFIQSHTDHIGLKHGRTSSGRLRNIMLSALGSPHGADCVLDLARLIDGALFLNPPRTERSGFLFTLLHEHPPSISSSQHADAMIALSSSIMRDDRLHFDQTRSLWIRTGKSQKTT